MSQSTQTSRRTRWLAGQTGVHIPYLNLLPASETVRYASASIAMLVSVLSAAAGWALVGSWSAAGVALLPRVALALGAGLAAGVVVWSVDRELISGDGHLGVRGVIGAVNALFVGEIVLLALFSPFVADQIQNQLTEQYDRAVLVAETDYDSAISAIGETESDARPPLSESLMADRANVADALQAVRELETQLAELNELRTAEVTGRVVVGEDGQPLTSGRRGDSGLATDSLDRQIADAEDALGRSVAQLDATQTRLSESEAAYTAAVDQAATQSGRFNDDRLAAQTLRDEAIVGADGARTAPVGLLGRIDVFHRAVWSDAVLAVAVLAVHIAVLAAELSVVLWAVNDRRRKIRLYPQLVAQIDEASTRALPLIALAVVDGAVQRGPFSRPNDVNTTTVARSTPLDEELTGLEIDLRSDVDKPAGKSSETHVHQAPTHGTIKPVAPPDLIMPSNPAAMRQLHEILEPRRIDITLLNPAPNVHGCTEALRPKRLAVLAYLALHRTADIDSVRQTFWPDSTSTSASSNTVSAIRKTLGAGNNGEPLLGGQGQGHLILSPEVGSDWTRFRQLTGDVPINGSPQDQLAFLVAALNLVAGPPAANAEGSPHNWEWLRRDSTGSGSVAAAIRETADQLILLAQDAGHLDLVAWAVAQAKIVGDYEPPAHPAVNGSSNSTEALTGQFGAESDPSKTDDAEVRPLAFSDETGQ